MPAEARILPLQPMQALSMDDQRKVLPAYTVTPLKRETVVNVAVKDDLGFRVVPRKQEVDGYMVRTMRGDSIFVTHEELVRMKLDRNLVPMVLDGGDDTTVAVQQTAGAQLNEQQQRALDVFTQLVENNPDFVNKLLAMTEQQPQEE